MVEVNNEWRKDWWAIYDQCSWEKIDDEETQAEFIENFINNLVLKKEI